MKMYIFCPGFYAGINNKHSKYCPLENIVHKNIFRVSDQVKQYIFLLFSFITLLSFITSAFFNVSKNTGDAYFRISDTYRHKINSK
jgi:hypothetical protein